MTSSNKARQSRTDMRNSGRTQALSPGQHCPSHCPQPVAPQAPGTPGAANPALGTPLDIRAAAALIGCSPWTVRQRLIPMGLPFFRSTASGKMIFYTNQITRWIERKQKEDSYA